MVQLHSHGARVAQLLWGGNLFPLYASPTILAAFHSQGLSIGIFGEKLFHYDILLHHMLVEDFEALLE